VSIIFNMHEAKTQLSKLVEQACAGEDIVIARDGKPAVRLVAVNATSRDLRPFGGDYAGKIVIHDDFNDPMPEDFMKSFE
jgi:prevent-host-death family protein